jgi:hypothetical protein
MVGQFCKFLQCLQEEKISSLFSGSDYADSDDGAGKKNKRKQLGTLF